MAFFGFIAHLSDGREVRESDQYWDAVPDGIVRLRLVEVSDDLGIRDVAGFEAEPGRRFFFCNEVVASRGGQGILSAKIMGYVDPDGYVTEVRLNMLPRLEGKPPELSKRTYPGTQFTLSESALRDAA